MRLLNKCCQLRSAILYYERLRTLCSGNITPKAITNLIDEQIRGTGTSLSTIRYLCCLTVSVVEGELNFSELSDLFDAEVMKN